MLVRWLLRRYGEQYGKRIADLPDRVMERLREHPWSGNIRELKNVMERIVLSSEQGEVDPDTVDLMLDKAADAPEIKETAVVDPFLAGSLDEIKHKVAAAVLAQEGNNVARTARRLQIDRNTLKKILR